MIKKYSLVFVAFLCFVLSGFGQLNITTTNTNYTIDFDNTVSGVNNGTFAGTGWQANPIAGRLDSDAWAYTGMSDGDLTFNGFQSGGDHGRGNSNFGVSTGGWYAFNNPGNGASLGCQPGSSDWTSGTLTLRIQNNTGVSVTELNLDYDIICFNDQPRANTFDFSHSADNSSYTNESSLDYTSPAAPSGSGALITSSRSISLTGLSIPNGAYYYLRWSGDDLSGSGSRDEFAIDNIVINAQIGTPTPELQLVDDTATNQNCGYTIDFGTQAVSTNTDLTFDIKNVGSADLDIS